MCDRQYFVSLILTLLAAGVALAAAVYWLWAFGWTGMGIGLVVTGALLGWFYCGPRADLAPRGGLHRRKPNAIG